MADATNSSNKSPVLSDVSSTPMTNPSNKLFAEATTNPSNKSPVLFDDDIKKLVGSGKKSLKILMVDGVGPDNYVTAVWFARLQQSLGETVHIVMMGRPVSFELAMFVELKDNEREEYLKKDDQIWPTKRVFVEAGYEKGYHKETHSTALLACTGFHMHKILESSGVDMTKVKLYDGGISARAGLSHCIHCYEDQFFDDEGFVRTLDEYKKVCRDLFLMHPDKRVILRLETCVKKFYRLRPLTDLKQELKEAAALKFFVGGPMTALAKVCDLDDSITKKPGIIRAMSGRWGKEGETKEEKKKICHDVRQLQHPS